MGQCADFCLVLDLEELSAVGSHFRSARHWDRLPRGLPMPPRRVGRVHDYATPTTMALGHSITSCARIMTIAGTVSPSILAVFMLMIRLNLVGCWNGSAPGSAPWRILST